MGKRTTYTKSLDALMAQGHQFPADNDQNTEESCLQMSVRQATEAILSTLPEPRRTYIQMRIAGFGARETARMIWPQTYANKPVDETTRRVIARHIKLYYPHFISQLKSMLMSPPPPSYNKDFLIESVTTQNGLDNYSDSRETDMSDDAKSES